MKPPKKDLTETIRVALQKELDGLARHDALEDRMAIIDKAIKFELMRRRGNDDEYGTAFEEET
jgi:hypothetical protein